MSISEQAFAYHTQGYSIMPCKQDKRPLLTSWKQYQTIPPTDDNILQWFSKETKNNIGIITGKLSNLTVIDIDTKQGTQQANADHLLTLFPATYTVQTPSGGYHLYYTYAEGFTISANAYPQYPNVDIRGEGGFVVAPPSITEQGEYKVIKQMNIQTFPIHLFPKTKPKRTLTEQTTASKGNRNDTLASFTGRLLQSEADESKWYTEVLPAVLRANKTYNPPLSDAEATAVFNSIVKKEKQRRVNLIVSPIQMEDDTNETIGTVQIKIKKNKAGTAHSNMANVIAVLQEHPYYKNNIRYNTFRHEIEYNGKPLEDADIFKIQYFMQTTAELPNVSDKVVYNALVHYAQQNKYDEAQEWLKAQVWDKTPRLATWLQSATGLPSDTYHSGVGSQWFMGIIRRIMEPGCIFDYMLVITGGQGLGKTSLFRIIGGNWYKSYTGTMDSKDFYLALRGTVLLDLDEGATLYKSEAIKIKSIITETHDEFRAPYDRVMKKYPRRFVFSMSTNDSEPFRDVTGNRRYWAIDIIEGVNFKWLEDNRDQLYAEAYYYYKNKLDLPEVPMEEAKQIQEAHLPDDSWTDLVVDEVRKSYEYCEGNANFSTSIREVFEKIFPHESLLRFDKRQEIRVANVFKKQLGLEKSRRMVDGDRTNRWYITPQKLKELQANNVKRTVDPLEEMARQDPLSEHF